MRPGRLLTVVIFVVMVLALPAFGKGGVRAKLEGTVGIGAAPGTAIPITWRLVSADGHAFGASGIYLRVSRCGGAAPQRVRARNLGAGRFSAQVVVPTRGIRKLRVGLAGWRTGGGKTERADALFEFDPPLVRRCGERS
jgi:hypothetical protein